MYKKFYSLIEGCGFLCISGRLQKASNYHSILVSEVHREQRTDVQSLHQEPVTTTDSVINIKPRGYY
jgi:hypothetical protein